VVLDDIRALRHRADGLNTELNKAVARARCENYSWNRIADALGVTKQAAWERFRARGIE
jgi:hypothetical protein